MIARIKTNDNNYYDTVVFALISDGWKSEIIGFNEELNQLEFIKIWNVNKSTVRSVFIIDSRKHDWVKNNNIEGYEWIISDKNLLLKIRKNKKIDSSLYNRCKDLLTKVPANEWFPIESYEDIDSILTATIGFHNSVVEKIETKEDYQIVEVTLNTSLGCKIKMKFEGDIEFNYDEDYGRMGEIFTAFIFLEGGFVYWVDSEIKSSKDIEPENCFFKSRKATWKIEII